MVQLRSCYFCGAVGDSLREYELVPEGVPSTDPSRSAVLCSTCREKLGRVFEPLIEAEPSSERSTPDPADSVAASTQEVTFDSDGAGDGDRDRDRDSVVTSEPSDDPSVEGNDATSGDGGAEIATKSEPDGEATESDDEPPGSGTDDDRGPAVDDGASEVPEAYYKVLRLLQNREFPMERADVTALVTGAYDVPPHECERILETAVERGVLVEQGSTLTLGRD